MGRSSAIRHGVVLLLGLLACDCQSAGDRPSPATHSGAEVATTAEAATVEAPVVATPPWQEVEASAVKGDVARGKALVARFECNRCHLGTGDTPQPFDRDCARCHRAVAAGTLPFPRERLDAWRKATRHFIHTPSLATVGTTLRATWIAKFLVEPEKVRTHQEEWMPRLPLTEVQAHDIAAFLTAGAAEPAAATKGDAARGADVVARKGCLVCHAFTGAKAPSAVLMPAVAADELARGMELAPDLRLVRTRVRPDVLAQWIRDPRSLRKDATMPTLDLTEEESRDAAAYLLEVPLAPAPSTPPFVRLPVLTRPVRFEEVATRVFRASCAHCHADAALARQADPGPGSTGGFGFARRGVQLLSYAGTQAGYLPSGVPRRRSLLTPESELESLGDSRLVAALVARHEEVAGRPVKTVRGMPLGLPPLDAESIQLVETWVSQGGLP